MSMEEVCQASDRFYTGMNRAFNGDASVMLEMEDVCSPGDDMSVMAEMGGRLTGWPAVCASWEAALEMVNGGSVNVVDLRITLLGEDAACTTGTVAASVILGATPLTFAARCTDIFRRENGVFKLVHHHLDPVPVPAPLEEALTQAS